MTATKYVEITLIRYASAYIIIRNSGRMGRYNNMFIVFDPLAAHQINEANYLNIFYERALKYNLEKNLRIALNGRRLI